MRIHQIAWADPNGYSRWRVSVIDPTSTRVPAVKKAATALIDAHAEHRALEKEVIATQDEPQRLSAAATDAARRAGADGTKLDPKALRKAVRDAEDAVADLRLELEAAAARLATKRTEYEVSVADFAAPLAAEARSAADEGILGLTTAQAMATRANDSLDGALAVLGGLSSLAERGVFEPMVPQASRHEFGQAGVPSIYAGIGADNLGAAIGLATTILDDLAAKQKAAAKAAKLQQEADEAEDEDMYDDEEASS